MGDDREMRDVAQAALDALLPMVDGANEPLPGALAIFDESFHEGVVGIVAGRIKDRFHRPTFVLRVVPTVCSRARADRSRAFTCATRSIW